MCGIFLGGCSLGLSWPRFYSLPLRGGASRTFASLKDI
jgi:hypothetical protein